MKAHRLEAYQQPELTSSQSLRSWRGQPLYPRHILHEQTPPDIEASPYARMPIGAGPFRITSWRYVGEPPAYEVEGIKALGAGDLAPAVQLITLERNPYFFGTRPSVDRLEIYVIPDAASLLSEFSKGRLDLVAEGSESAVLSVQSAEDKSTFVRSPSMRLERLDFNLSRRPLDQLESRRAIAAAIDREAIAQAAFEGQDVAAAGSWLSGASWAYLNVLGEVGAGAEDADALGIRPHAAKGVVIGADHEAVELEMLVLAGNPARDRVARNVKRDLAAIGINVVVRPVDAGTLLGLGGRLVSHDFDLALYSWQGTAEPAGTEMWHSASIPAEDNEWMGNNFAGWASQANDALLSAADTLGPQPDRVERYAAQQRLFAQDLPSLPLFEYPRMALVSRDIDGFALPAGPVPSTWNVENWRLTDSVHRDISGGGS